MLDRGSDLLDALGGGGARGAVDELDGFLSRGNPFARDEVDRALGDEDSDDDSEAGKGPLAGEGELEGPRGEVEDAGEDDRDGDHLANSLWSVVSHPEVGSSRAGRRWGRLTMKNG